MQTRNYVKRSLMRNKTATNDASKLAQRKRKQAYALQSVGWCYAGRLSGVWQLAATFVRGACSPASGRP